MSPVNEHHQPLGEVVEHWLPKAKPYREITLEGQYCLLEPLDVERHVAELFDSFWTNNQGESWTYLPYGPFYTLDALQEWFMTILHEEKDTLLYAIVSKKTRKAIGNCGYLRINPQHGVVEIGHVHYSAFLKKTPIATEAIYLMLSCVFDTLKYRRCEWKCHALNEPSRRAALRLGFQFEGIFRQSNVFKGHNRDTAWFSIIDKEWPLIKERLEKWLSPSNFDHNGKQISPLSDI